MYHKRHVVDDRNSKDKRCTVTILFCSATCQGNFRHYVSAMHSGGGYSGGRWMDGDIIGYTQSIAVDRGKLQMLQRM